MPNIFCVNNYNNISKYKSNGIKLICLDKNNVDYTKNFSPANNEWFNSIYAYNKKNIRYLPIIDRMVIKLIKSYFNFFSPKYENKITSNMLRIRLRRLSINRIFVSKANLKHTNSKVIITLSIYNRQKIYFLNKLKFFNKISKKNIYLLKKIKLQGIKIINLINKLLRILKKSLKLIRLPYISKLNVKHDLNKIKLDKMLF